MMLKKQINEELPLRNKEENHEGAVELVSGEKILQHLSSHQSICTSSAKIRYDAEELDGPGCLYNESIKYN